MGSALFERFPERVREADEVLGFSIRDLCLSDPQAYWVKRNSPNRRCLLSQRSAFWLIGKTAQTRRIATPVIVWVSSLRYLRQGRLTLPPALH